MFETTKIVLINTKRSLFKKIEEAPFLYFFFLIMMLGSIFLFAFVTFFLTYSEFEVSINEIFLGLFSIFTIKAIVDFYNNYTKSLPLSYSLSTQTNQTKIAFEIFLAVLITQLTVWFSLSLFYIFSLSIFRINLWYPVEYLQFTLGIICTVLLGTTIAVYFFSSKKYRLMPTIILLTFFFYSQNYLYIVYISPLIVLHFIWAIRHSISSYLYVKRKERLKGKYETKIRNKISAIANKEIIILYRENLIFSFILTAVTTGLFTGYLFLNGTEILIPDSLKDTVADILPSSLLLLGVYVIVFYTAVFPSLALFLNEDKTLWIIRNLPVKNETFVFGKAKALILCFITTIPFIAYVSIFIGMDDILYLFWFLVFSYLAGVIIAFPLGVKYVGRKSDILLLYTVAIILLAVLGFGSIFGRFVGDNFELPIIFYFLIIMFEMFILYLSLKASSKILALKY